MSATLLLVEHRWGPLDVRDQLDTQRVPVAGARGGHRRRRHPGLSWTNANGHFGRGYALCWFVGTVVGLAPLMGRRPGRARGQAPIAVAGLSTHYPRGRMTTLPAAEGQCRRGCSEASATRHRWWSDTALDQAFRPRSLRLTD